jgi:acetate kinase
MQRHQMDAAAIQDLIYRKSGLLGVSGTRSDRAVRLSDLRPAPLIKAMQA